jgi:hypothetical protein
MEAAVREEWDAIPQEWINQLILKHEHWVHVWQSVEGGQLLIKLIDFVSRFALKCVWKPVRAD